MLGPRLLPQLCGKSSKAEVLTKVFRMQDCSESAMYLIDTGPAAKAKGQAVVLQILPFHVEWRVFIIIRKPSLWDEVQ